MVTLIPEEPTFTTSSERLVWERLRDSLGSDDVLMSNQRLTDESKDYEADLIVLMPECGVLVLEVKGGSVWFDNGWWVRRNRQPAKVDPVSQARDAMYAFRAYVERDPRWGSRSRVAWAHGVVTPFSEFPPEFEVPQLPRWALHDRLDLAHLVNRVREHAWGWRRECALRRTTTWWRSRRSWTVGCRPRTTWRPRPKSGRQVPIG